MEPQHKADKIYDMTSLPLCIGPLETVDLVEWISDLNKNQMGPYKRPEKRITFSSKTVNNKQKETNIQSMVSSNFFRKNKLMS